MTHHSPSKFVYSNVRLSYIYAFEEELEGILQSQRWQDKQISYGQLARLIFICSVVILLLAIAVAWILSDYSIIPAAWATIILSICVILGLLLGFLQWYVPHASTNSQTSIALSEQTLQQQIHLLPSISAEDDAYRTFIDGERKKLSDAPNPHSTGELVIRADKSLVNEAVIASDRSVIISERTEKGQNLYIGIIKDLPAGNHYATTPQRQPRGFTIHKREVTEIDLRNEHRA